MEAIIMCINFLKQLKLRPVIAALFFITSLNLAVDTSAEESWWNRGTNIIKNIGGSDKETALSVEDIGAGLKDALRVGADSVVSRLGRVDGFNKDPSVHIPLPKQLGVVKSALDRAKMGHLLDDLELKLNRAAEVATPRAKELFLQAITEMSFEDVTEIYKGPEDSATKYFKGKMALSLADVMKPVIDESLVEVKAIQTYDNAIKEYKALPFVPDVKANLSDYVVQKGMDGIFFYMAKEEAAIRQNPAKRTTDILKRVFGTK